MSLDPQLLQMRYFNDDHHASLMLHEATFQWVGVAVNFSFARLLSGLHPYSKRCGLAS